MLPRLLLFTLVLFCVELGAFLIALPWTAVWERNFFLFRYPELAGFLLNYGVRGGITGLGLVDLGLAVWYAANYRALLARWQGEALKAEKKPAESIHGDQTS